MLPASELRVGNMVALKYGYRVVGLHKVLAIEENEIKLRSYSLQDKEPDGWADYNNLFGINLTPTILLSCGFEWDEDRYDGETKVYKLGNFEVCYEEDQKIFCAAINDNDGNICFLPAKLKHLHQLQNYFIITGNELNVNNIRDVKAN